MISDNQQEENDSETQRGRDIQQNKNSTDCSGDTDKDKGKNQTQRATEAKIMHGSKIKDSQTNAEKDLDEEDIRFRQRKSM